MRAFHLLLNQKSILIIFLCTLFSFQIFAQKNSDGSYTLKKPDGSIVTYFAKHPGKSEKSVDTLEVVGQDGVFEKFYRIDEKAVKMKMSSPPGIEYRVDILEGTNKQQGKHINYDGSLSTRYSSPPTCDCEVDTVIVELLDGSIEEYYYVMEKSMQRKDMISIKGEETYIDVYENAEQMPKFLNGYNDLKQYIEKNVQFNNGKRYTGQLVLKFIVLKDGKIENVKVDRTYGALPEGLEKDIERILKNMPAWKPGKVNGNPVNVFYNLQLNLS